MSTSALNPQQFGTRTANESDNSINGQSGSANTNANSSTTTTVTVRGSAPAISTRSS